MWWIKVKDKETYEKLMIQSGSQPRIIQEDGEYLQVEFSQSALSVWVQAGYWFGDRPNFVVRLYKKFLTLIRR